MILLIAVPENELERASCALKLWPKCSQKVYQNHKKKVDFYTLRGYLYHGAFIAIHTHYFFRQDFSHITTRLHHTFSMHSSRPLSAPSAGGSIFSRQHLQQIFCNGI